MTTFQPTPRPTSSPWGRPDSATEIAPGIWTVSTPSHGGYIVSPERLAAMPDVLKINHYGEGCCFEEDCETALVVLAFPQDFPPGAETRAKLHAAGMVKFHDSWAKVAAAYPVQP